MPAYEGLGELAENFICTIPSLHTASDCDHQHFILQSRKVDS
jgi:hypothetical protein